MIIGNRLLIIVYKINNTIYGQMNEEMSNQNCINLKTRNQIGQ